MSAMDGDVTPADICVAKVDALSVGSDVILGVDVFLTSADAVAEADASADEGLSLLEMLDVLIELRIDLGVDDICPSRDSFVVDV